ncbi:DNA cytosine methyltransferase [Limosilactobacillus vaginalis]|uniref:DNA cytosine methyltransferase n=1 Tax=Limosilactobacillus vaginalis TaxID=1633 RepID=UPI0025A46591|nr:DNA cytosine methyltransferase [Limosilactobacillus vaginalis]MDM8222005.1 DNA cytosine methyltransferase [Limosilactobacillus vaginalis]
MSRKLTFIDMFAGIGGFRSGMEQAGHKCVGWIEWDKFARQSYQAMYDTEGEYNAKDIRQVQGSALPDSDVWCFGFPCQDVSSAGKQAGLLNGKRSGLFFEVVRLLQERARNKETLPKTLFIENVKNLLSIDGGWGFARMQIELDQAGYDIEWSVINSAQVVPQNRERVYIIGHLRKECTAKVFPIIGQSRTANQKQSVRVVGHYGNQKHQSNTVISDQGVSNTLSATDYKHPQVVVHQIGNVSKSKSFGGNPQVGRVYATDGLAPTLNTMQGGGRQPKIIVKRPLKGKTRNGWHFEQECYSPDSITGALKAGGGSGNIPKIVKSRINSQAENYVIRKLTPLECWRLQGFTDEQFNKAKNAGLSNTQLYKQAGNSVTVPVIKAIAERLRGTILNVSD